MLLLLLLGIFYAFRNNDCLAGFFWGFSVALKIVPALLPIWLFLRGKRKMAAIAFLTLVVCIFLSLSRRGIEQGMKDYREFYQKVVLPTQTELYHPGIFNFSLSGALVRVLHSPENISDLTPAVNILNLSSNGVTTTIKLVRYGFLILLILMAWLRRRYQIIYHEFAIMILLILILSPQTYTTHFVWLLPVYVSILQVNCFRRPSFLKWVAYGVPLILLIAQPYFITMRVWRLLASYQFWTICIIGLLIIAMIKFIFCQKPDI
ncbi:MAG: glycosyltransferase 87 family protein [Candidatus Edwardsbacteria bacterium]